MNPETIDKVTQYLDKISAKIGVGIGSIWPWLVKQQIVDAWYSFAMFIISFLISSFLISIFFKNKKKWENDECWILFVVGYSMTLSSLLSIVALVCWFKYFPAIFNPEYAALMDLINKIK